MRVINRTTSSGFAVFFVLAGFNVCAMGAVVANVSGGPDGTFTVDPSDLINQGQSTFSSAGFVGTDAFGNGVNSLNNGLMYSSGIDDTNGSLTPAAGGVATFVLDTSVNTLGYQIDSITSYTSFSGGQRTGQHYEIAFSTVGDAGFSAFTTVDFAGDGDPQRRVTVSDDAAAPLAVGVDAIQITFFAGTNFEHLVYREFDVVGSAAIVPEPATCGLALWGVVGLMYARRRHRHA